MQVLTQAQDRSCDHHVADSRFQLHFYVHIRGFTQRRCRERYFENDEQGTRSRGRVQYVLSNWRQRLVLHRSRLIESVVRHHRNHIHVPAFHSRDRLFRTG